MLSSPFSFLSAATTRLRRLRPGVSHRAVAEVEDGVVALAPPITLALRRLANQGALPRRRLFMALGRLERTNVTANVRQGARQRCPYRKSYPTILVMEPAHPPETGRPIDVAGRLDGTRDGASLFNDRCVRVAKLISRINRRISSGTFGRPPPILDRQRQVGPEPPTGPTKDRLRLDNCQDVPNTGEQPIEADKYQSVDVAEEGPLRRRSPQDIDLLAQHEVLRCERCSRSEQHQEHRPNQSAKVPYRTAVSLGSSSPATRITFAIGTGAGTGGCDEAQARRRRISARRGSHRLTRRRTTLRLK
jgi:hypothetical protein